MSFATEIIPRKKRLSVTSAPRLSLSSLSTAPLLSNFDEPVKRRSTRDSPLLLFDALHEDGMAVKKLGNQLKNCSFLFLMSCPAFPAVVALSFFTLNWFLAALGVMVAQALLGSTGLRVGKKRKIKKASSFLRWMKLFTGAFLTTLAAYQCHAFVVTALKLTCTEADLREVCVERKGWDHVHLLLLCGLPLLDLFLLVFLLYVIKVSKSFERALVNDLIGLNAAWQK